MVLFSKLNIGENMQLADTLSAEEKEKIYQRCGELDEAVVLAILERTGGTFVTVGEKGAAWEWIYKRRLQRDLDTADAVRKTAAYTRNLALATFIVALCTAAPVIIDFIAKH